MEGAECHAAREPCWRQAPAAVARESALRFLRCDLPRGGVGGGAPVSIGVESRRQRRKPDLREMFRSGVCLGVRLPTPATCVCHRGDRVGGEHCVLQDSDTGWGGMWERDRSGCFHIELCWLNLTGGGVADKYLGVGVVTGPKVVSCPGQRTEASLWRATGALNIGAHASSQVFSFD